MSPASDPTLALVILAFAALGAYRGGIVTAGGWLAMAAGIALGVLAGTPIQVLTGRNLALSVAIVAGATMAATLYGMRLGRIEAALAGRWPRVHRSLADRLAGAGLGMLAGAALAWLVVLVLSAAPGTQPLHRELERSAIAHTLLEVGPPVGPSTRLLARSEFFPALAGPLVTVDEPDERILAVPAITVAARSVIRIEGATTCGLSVGSGWVQAPGVIVTNAHVVAGHAAGETVVTSVGITRPRRATVVAFDPVLDIAVLHAPGLQLPPLRPTTVLRESEPAAVLGHTVSGRFSSAARLDFVSRWPGVDIYDQPAPDRDIVVFRGRVDAGNSGGPLVNARGEVLGTVYAATVDQPRAGGYAVTNADTLAVVARAGTSAVPTGDCATG